MDIIKKINKLLPESTDPIIDNQKDYVRKRLSYAKRLSYKKKKDILKKLKNAESMLDIEEIHMELDDLGIKESKFPIYGEQKSKEYLKFRQEVFDATKDSQLTQLMKQMEMSMKKGKLDYEEMIDLIDKVDQKKMKINKGGKRVSGSKKIDKFQNKVRSKR